MEGFEIGALCHAPLPGGPLDQGAGEIIRIMIAKPVILPGVIGAVAGMVQCLRTLFRLSRRGDRLTGMQKGNTMATLPPRFDVTRDEIACVVAAFYARIRAHPGLGPVFAAHVGDWPAHEARIVDFWANAILHERCYDGNPVAVHRAAGDVRPGMFDTWLALFDRVLAEELRADQAAAWSALAHRIGRSLRAGVVERMQGPGGVPILR